MLLWFDVTFPTGEGVTRPSRQQVSDAPRDGGLGLLVQGAKWEERRYTARNANEPHNW